MIPAAFNYHRPKSTSEAVRLLGDLGDDARPLSGGHSLIPMMKLRLAKPSDLVDLGAIAELKGVREEGSDLVLGAGLTQHELIASPVVKAKAPILVEAAQVIADPQVRYVGTIGGNLANGDPGNDLPAVMMCLGASYRLVGRGGERTVAARSFYQGFFTTALGPSEIVASIRIPPPKAGHGYAYEKLKRKVGDYATAAAAVILSMEGGRVASCSIGLTNVAATPLLAEEAARILAGSNLDPDTVKRAVAAAEAITSPTSDTRGSARYRTKMAGVMLMRALERAKSRAST